MIAVNRQEFACVGVESVAADGRPQRPKGRCGLKAVHEGWGYVDSGFRRNDGGGKGLVQVFLKPAVHEGWGYVDSGFRRNDGGGAGMTEGVPERRRGGGKGLVQMFVKPAVHEGWGYVDSGFRRNDGGVPE